MFWKISCTIMYNSKIVIGNIAVYRKQFITVTSQWASWCLKSPAIRLFVQFFVLAVIKDNIEAQVTGPLWLLYASLCVTNNRQNTINQTLRDETSHGIAS